jgi:hypothetical protein
MADPVTIMMVASTAMSAVGALQAGEAADAQAKAQADANRYNAQVKELQAGVERQVAGRKEEAQRREARQVLGEQRAALAQSGVQLGTGSAADIQEQSATMAELDALTIRYQGEMAAKGLLYDAEADKFEASANIAAGKNAKTASYLQAGSAILSGGTDIAKYNAMKKA